jgi:hypothetical protein
MLSVALAGNASFAGQRILRLVKTISYEYKNEMDLHERLAPIRYITFFVTVPLGFVCMIILFIRGDYNQRVGVVTAIITGVGTFGLTKLSFWMGKTMGQIERAETAARAEPEKAKPAWDVARLKMERYLTINLSQMGAIFWVSIGTMLIGFGAIFWGIEQGIAFAEHSEKLDSIKSLPAFLAACSGIITEFIGVTFLIIYRSTMKQATSYFKTLERINSVGMATQILDAMPDEALRNQTRSELIKLLLQGANEQKEK